MSRCRNARIQGRGRGVLAQAWQVGAAPLPYVVEVLGHAIALTITKGHKHATDI